MSKLEHNTNKVRHYLMKNNQLSAEDFKVISSLDKIELEEWCSIRRVIIQRVLNKIGIIVEYQMGKKYLNRKLLFSKKQLSQSEYLWSDVIGLDCEDTSLSVMAYGLLLLSVYNLRLARIWSIRIDHPIPDAKLIVSNELLLKHVLTHSFLDKVLSQS